MNLTFELLVSCLGPLLGRLLAGLRFPILSCLGSTVKAQASTVNPCQTCAEKRALNGLEHESFQKTQSLQLSVSQI